MPDQYGTKSQTPVEAPKPNLTQKENLTQQTKRKAAEMGETIKEKANEVGDKITETAQQAQQKLNETTENARQRISETTENARQKWNETSQQTQQKLQETGQKIAETKENIVQKVQNSAPAQKFDEAKNSQTAKSFGQTVQNAGESIKHGFEDVMNRPIGKEAHPTLGEKIQEVSGSASKRLKETKDQVVHGTSEAIHQAYETVKMKTGELKRTIDGTKQMETEHKEHFGPVLEEVAHREHRQSFGAVLDDVTQKEHRNSFGPVMSDVNQREARRSFAGNVLDDIDSGEPKLKQIKTNP